MRIFLFFLSFLMAMPFAHAEEKKHKLKAPPVVSGLSRYWVVVRWWGNVNASVIAGLGEVSLCGARMAVVASDLKLQMVESRRPIVGVAIVAMAMKMGGSLKFRVSGRI